MTNPVCIFYSLLQIISYNSPRGGVSVLTEKGETTTSYLLIQQAKPTDSGRYSCNPSNAVPHSILVHVLNGKLLQEMSPLKSCFIWGSTLWALKNRLRFKIAFNGKYPAIDYDCECNGGFNVRPDVCNWKISDKVGLLLSFPFPIYSIKLHQMEHTKKWTMTWIIYCNHLKCFINVCTLAQVLMQPGKTRLSFEVVLRHLTTEAISLYFLMSACNFLGREGESKHGTFVPRDNDYDYESMKLKRGKFLFPDSQQAFLCSTHEYLQKMSVFNWMFNVTFFEQV